MYIISIGHAFPETCISNDLLEELQPALAVDPDLKRSGIMERRSVLPMDFLKHGNYSSAEAYKIFNESPTQLAVRAARIAIERAGIETSQIGLMIGDCSTPSQVTPSEGQRVAARLELRIPTFDITAAQGAFIVHLNVIKSWKPERIPDYVLCITTHTPTASINYKKGKTGIFFGDGAAAYILSAKIPGKLIVEDTSVSMNSHLVDGANIDHYGFLKVPDDYLKTYVEDGVVREYESWKIGKDGRRRFFIGPQSDLTISQEIGGKLGFTNDTILSLGERTGETIGASLPSVLSENWNLFNAGDEIYSIQAGLGLQSGRLKLKVGEP